MKIETRLPGLYAGMENGFHRVPRYDGKLRYMFTWNYHCYVSVII
jgi:hypothetical protein